MGEVRVIVAQVLRVALAGAGRSGRRRRPPGRRAQRVERDRRVQRGGVLAPSASDGGDYLGRHHFREKDSKVWGLIDREIGSN